MVPELVRPHAVHDAVVVHCLPVGFFEDPKRPARFRHVVGNRLSTHVRLRTVANERGHYGLVTEHFALYECVDEPGYLVHSIFERHDTSPPMLGVVERFATWREMSNAHPTLAQRANRHAAGPRNEERVIRVELGDLDPRDPAYSFG
jgi:hypothetical protein